MPGSGTFNLTALWRALGIKNPKPRMFETIQPTIQVADFSSLTPQHRPPTSAFGGDTIFGGGFFSFVQLTSRAPGGTLLPIVQSGTSELLWSIEDLPVAAGAAVVPLAQMSAEPSVALVEKGVVGPIPHAKADSPHTIATGFSIWPFNNYSLWIPPGKVFVMFKAISNQAILGWTIVAQDVPAMENPEA